jgi:hypothetical protein
MLPIEIIVFLDPYGNIIDQISANNDSDTIYACARELTKTEGMDITPHYAIIQIGEKYTDKIHKDIGHSRPAITVKNPLDTCHKYDLCCATWYEENQIDVLSRCSICPRRDK